MRTIDLSTLARLGMTESDVHRWVTDFGEHLSASAKRTQAPDRHFTLTDLCVLLYVQDQIECGNCLEEIDGGLGSREQYSDTIVETARLYSPLFQDVPDEIDETWRHGVLIGGIANRDWIQVARSYKRSADILIVEALKSDEPHVYDYPIFYLYRHCLELYLKTIVDGSMRGHDFAKLVKAVEDKCHKTLGGWIRERLWDFQEIDRKSDMFRYPEYVNDGELWIDFYHLKDVMDSIIESFEQHLAVEGRLAH